MINYRWKACDGICETINRINISDHLILLWKIIKDLDLQSAQYVDVFPSAVPASRILQKCKPQRLRYWIIERFYCEHFVSSGCSLICSRTWKSARYLIFQIIDASFKPGYDNVQGIKLYVAAELRNLGYVCIIEQRFPHPIIRAYAKEKHLELNIYFYITFNGFLYK